MTITTAQIRGARGILGWSQQDLAQRTGISATSIGAIENNQTTPRENTLTTIRKAFESGGIEFRGYDGLRKRDNTLTTIEKISKDDYVYLRLMDDIYYTIKETGGEVLFSYVSQELSPPEVIKRQKDIREICNGMRFLVKYGDKNLRYEKKEYRYLPEGRFITNPCVIYGNKCAMMINQWERVLIINDENFAAIKRNEFDIIWNYGDAP